MADLLHPGDVVEVDGGQTYPGGVAFEIDGEVGNPITIRGLAVEDLAIENGDVVGNVLVKTETSYVTRFGGDGTGQTFGHYWFVNNTVVVQPGGSAVLRLFDGIGSLEAHDNVLFSTDGSPVNVVRDADANWGRQHRTRSREWRQPPDHRGSRHRHRDDRSGRRRWRRLQLQHAR